MKDDERRMLERVLWGDVPMYAGAALDIHPNRVHRICEKWITKGWFECGVSARTGWITDAEKAREAMTR